MKRVIAITGGHGVLGRAVLEAALAAGLAVARTTELGWPWRRKWRPLCWCCWRRSWLAPRGWQGCHWQGWPWRWWGPPLW